MKPSVLIAIPAYGGMITTDFCISLIALLNQFRASAIECEFLFVSNDSLITRARNTLANAFYFDSAYSHLLMIDADIGFRTEDIQDALALNEDVVGLPCARKEINWQTVTAAVRAGVPTEQLPKVGTIPVTNLLKYGEHIPTNKAFEVKAVGTGILLVKREAFDKLSAAHPEWKYRLMASEQSSTRDFAYSFFNTSVDDSGFYLSEDFKFCADWRKLGGKIHLLPTAITTHQGPFKFICDSSEITIP